MMKDRKQLSLRQVLSVLTQTLILLVVINLLFTMLPPSPDLSTFSLYNRLFPGRWRLPWSENSAEAYNLSLDNLPAMFNSHQVAASPAIEDEFRVFLLGDSSVWGFLLEKESTIAGQLNQMDLRTSDGESVRFYNLGYPTISLFKDLMLLDQAMAYQPNMIIWFTTLEAFPREKQAYTSFVQHNPELANQMIDQFGLNLSPLVDQQEDLFSRTIFGRRREVADLLRLQLYGIPWAATGVDQYFPKTYQPLQIDFEVDETFYDFLPESFNQETLAFDVLAAGIEHAGDIPVLIVNEPIFISSGENSDIRYNFYYPRWAYDAYRQLMDDSAADNGWDYVDLWNLISPEVFTNTAIHVSPAGVAEIARALSLELTHFLDN